MKAWVRTVMLLTLICYLAVSSVASVHAFPSGLSTIETSQASTNIFLEEMSPSCHQQTDDAQSKAASACKIFCSAMGNIIIDDVAAYLPSSGVSAEIAFLSNGVTKLSLAMEPHPPK